MPTPSPLVFHGGEEEGGKSKQKVLLDSGGCHPGWRKSFSISHFSLVPVSVHCALQGCSLANSDGGEPAPGVISDSSRVRVTRCSPESTSRAASVTHALLGTCQDEGADGSKRFQLCSGEFHLFLLEKKDKSSRAQGVFGQLSQAQGFLGCPV